MEVNQHNIKLIKMKKIIRLVNIFCCILIVGNLQAQKINIREFAAVKNVDPSEKKPSGN